MLLAFHQVCRYGLDWEEDESDTVGMRLGRVDCSLIWASCDELEFWSVSGRVSHVEYPSQFGCFYGLAVVSLSSGVSQVEYLMWNIPVSLAAFLLLFACLLLQDNDVVFAFVYL